MSRGFLGLGEDSLSDFLLLGDFVALRSCLPLLGGVVSLGGVGYGSTKSGSDCLRISTSFW